MIGRKFQIFLLWPLFFCASAQADDRSKLAGLEFRTGTSRAAVESAVASALGRKSDYSPYGNNLNGGTVEYVDGEWILEVTYKPGAPAPRIAVQGGSQDLPPVDETVERFQLRRRGK